MATTPVYELISYAGGGVIQFFTMSTAEHDAKIAEGDWLDNGVVWQSPVNGGTEVYRLHNPDTDDYHYTMDANERDAIVTIGYEDEGIAFRMVDTGTESVTPVYRLYSSYIGNHHYTANAERRDALLEDGWIDEGISFYVIGASASEPEPEPVTGLSPVYQVSMGIGNTTQYLTMSAAERDAKIDPPGWDDDGVAWLSPSSGGVAVHRLSDEYGGLYVYVIDEKTISQFVKNGWTDEGVAFRAVSMDAENAVPVYDVSNDYGEHWYTTSAKEASTMFEWLSAPSIGIAFYVVGATASPDPTANPVLPAETTVNVWETTGLYHEDLGATKKRIRQLECVSSDAAVVACEISDTPDGDTAYKGDVLLTGLAKGTATVSLVDTDGNTVTSTTVTVPDPGIPMYRMYNPNSGEHFYSANGEECVNLFQQGWESEGIAWVAPSEGSPVYRLYNPVAGDHHYTASTAERDGLKALGWRDEGVGWMSDGDMVVLREYNPNAVTGAHNFTLSSEEDAGLGAKGWSREGEAWKALREPNEEETDEYTAKKALRQAVEDARDVLTRSNGKMATGKEYLRTSLSASIDEGSTLLQRSPVYYYRNGNSASVLEAYAYRSAATDIRRLDSLVRTNMQK